MFKLLKRAGIPLAVTVLSVMATSCDAIYDYEGDCDPHYYVKFVYDMNMLYSDAFAAKVNSVDLYVFDGSTGQYLAQFSESGEALAKEGYMMPLYLEPGNYEFIAWCGLDNNEGHFNVGTNISHKTHAECTMARSKDTEGNAMQDANLNALFHGKISVSLPATEGDHVYTVYLTKDTNNINISMQHLSKEFDPEQFTVTMSDNNGYIAHDNSLKDDETIIYHPWAIRAGSAEINTKSEDDGKTNFLQVEISTSRLTTDHNPIITVTDNETGQTVFSIPITKWALQLRSQNYQNMEDQEYLDREDQFNVMLYLDNKDENGWYAASVLVNGWHIIDNNL